MAATLLIVQRMSKGDQNKVKPIVVMNEVKKTHNAHVKACSHQERKTKKTCCMLLYNTPCTLKVTSHFYNPVFLSTGRFSSAERLTQVTFTLNPNPNCTSVPHSQVLFTGIFVLGVNIRPEYAESF